MLRRRRSRRSCRPTRSRLSLRYLRTRFVCAPAAQLVCRTDARRRGTTGLLQKIDDERPKEKEKAKTKEKEATKAKAKEKEKQKEQEKAKKQKKDQDKEKAKKGNEKEEEKEKGNERAKRKAETEAESGPDVVSGAEETLPRIKIRRFPPFTMVSV